MVVNAKTKQEEVREGILGYLGCPKDGGQPDRPWDCENWDKTYGCNRCADNLPAANGLMQYLHDNNVVIKVDRNLAIIPYKPVKTMDKGYNRGMERGYKCGAIDTIASMGRAGYVAVESLIREYNGGVEEEH